MTRLLFALIAAVTLTTACQRPEQKAAGPAKAGNRLKIVYIPKNTGNPYFGEAVKGFEEACLELGHDFFTTAPAAAEATSQIPILKEQIQRGVDVIAITPNSPDALNVVLDEAEAKGVLVVTVDADLVGNETHRAAAVLPTDFSKLGESQVELIGSLIGYEGDIAILSATADAPNQNEWIKGMRSILAQPKYAKMKLVEVVYGDDEPQKSTTEFEALLAKHPDLRGVISPTSVGLAAAAQSLDLAGVYPGGSKAKGAGLKLTGLSTPDQLRRFVDKGVVEKFQLWSPKDMGYLAVHLVTAVKSGRTDPVAGVEFDAGRLGKRTFGENGVVNTGPLVTFDKTNISDYKF